MTPSDLDMFKVKNTNMHVTYTPGAQIFVCFALWWAVFELRPNFWKSAPNDPKWPWHVQGQKYQYACYIHPWGPNFRPCFTLRQAVFELRATFRKSAPNDPKWHWHVQSHKYQQHVTYTPEAKIFVRFALQWAVFDLRPTFQTCAPNDPKWPRMTLTCSR